MDETAVMHARPAPEEIAVVSVPAGASVRVHTAAGPVEHTADAEPMVVVVPGDRERLGWGVLMCLYYDRSDIRKWQHPLDRPLWQQASKALRNSSVVYIRFERTDYYGRPRWTAVDLRVDTMTDRITLANAPLVVCACGHPKDRHACRTNQGQCSECYKLSDSGPPGSYCGRYRKPEPQHAAAVAREVEARRAWIALRRQW